MGYNKTRPSSPLFWRRAGRACSVRSETVRPFVHGRAPFPKRRLSTPVSSVRRIERIYNIQDLSHFISLPKLSHFLFSVTSIRSYIATILYLKGT